MGEGNAGLWFKIAFGASKENFLENIIIVTHMHFYSRNVFPLWLC